MASKEYAEKAWVEFKNVKVLQRPNVAFVHGTVTNVDCESKTATISERRTQKTRTERYDFFIAATGLRRVWPVVPQALTRENYLTEVGAHIERVLNSTAPVLVVGGGQNPPTLALPPRVTDHLQVLSGLRWLLS
jgi:NADH dehydrogenase FAD-containing subunit